MAKAKLVAVYAYTKRSTNSSCFVLDGTPEQHEEYLLRADAKYQPEDGWAAEDGLLSELKGNPTFHTVGCMARIIEISIPSNPKLQPKMETTALDQAKADAVEYCEQVRPVVEKHRRMLDTHRASVVSTESVEENLDGLD